MPKTLSTSCEPNRFSYNLQLTTEGLMTVDEWNWLSSYLEN